MRQVFRIPREAETRKIALEGTAGAGGEGRGQPRNCPPVDFWKNFKIEEEKKI
jgi:hypothetical protein